MVNLLFYLFIYFARLSILGLGQFQGQFYFTVTDYLCNTVIFLTPNQCYKIIIVALNLVQLVCKFLKV